MGSKVDVVGQRFGRLYVTQDGAHVPGKRRVVHCLCDCGASVITDPRSLLAGDTNSCGCWKREQVASRNSARTNHGFARKGSRNGAYNSWQKLKGRCTNPLDAKFKDYGARGITVCQQWIDDFSVFLEDMGPKPSSRHTIDRIDNNGNYEPGNCRWSLPLEQSRNKRTNRLVVFDGKEMPLSQACEEAGVNYRSALYRLNHGKDWKPLDPPPQPVEDRP